MSSEALRIQELLAIRSELLDKKFSDKPLNHKQRQRLRNVRRSLDKMEMRECNYLKDYQRKVEGYLKGHNTVFSVNLNKLRGLIK